MDRATRRYNETRTITITQVDMTNHLVTGRDQYGTLLQISFHLTDAITAIPGMGELWTVERNGNMWFLDKRGDDGTETTGLKSLSAGDRRIDTSGDIHLNSTNLFINGSSYPPPPSSTVGLLAAQPPFGSLPAGSQYYATDQDVMYINTGAAWQRTGLPAGSTTLMFGTNAVAPNGWVRYDGGTLSGSTGIYAQLYAHLGSTTTLPDTRGRVGVDKGTHGDVLLIGNNDGLVVGNRRPKHKSSITRTADVAISNPGYELRDVGTATGYGGGGGDGVPTGGVTITTQPVFTVGPQTGAEPIDSPAYLVGLLIAKL